VLVFETDIPMAIRRSVAFSEAVNDGASRVEDMDCYLAKSLDDALKLLGENTPMDAG